jgi:hypothetical protein
MKSPHFLRITFALLLTVLSVPFSKATTVVAPQFDELVAKADYVVRANVKSVTSSWRDVNGQRAIYTQVELTVKNVVAGTPPSPVVLEVLGGQVGDQILEVDGVPQFTVGDEGIFFVQGNGIQFCPLVAVMHGNYRIKRDRSTAKEYVARDDGSPLENEQEVARPMKSSHAASSQAQATTGLTPDEFVSKIRASRQASNQKNKLQK